jgi:SAM-dependent methyltransferase
MDDLARYNKERWEELARADIEFSRPALDLDAASARRMLDPHGLLGGVEGKSVLCLASGGGQQSAAFGILGADVTVFDLSETQLERDREAAAHHGHTVKTVQGDMRDLSRLAGGAFDVVWHAHSIKFVPEVRSVFREVARVLRPGGLYQVDCPNPFIAGVDESDWNGEGYPLKLPYVDGAEVLSADGRWEVWDRDGNRLMVEGPKEFRHSLSTLVNGLVGNGFQILGLWEDLGGDADAAPGTWEHFKRVAPPGFSLWGRYLPEVLTRSAGES